MAVPEAAKDARRLKRRRRFVEAISIVLLACAGVATSWSSYQASRWGGEQSTSYSRANALRLESTRASAAAEQLRAIDVAVFMAWLEAYVAGNDTLQGIYDARMRDEFEPAFRAWLAAKPLENEHAPATPFALPEYRLAKAVEATALAEQAEREFAAGHDANERSDAYVLNAVLLATMLFFAGIAQQFKSFPVQAALLLVAAALLAAGVLNIATFPKA